MELKDSHGRLRQTDCSGLARQPTGHLVLQAQSGPAEAPLSPELLELVPRGSFPSPFLQAVSEHVLRLDFPLVALFSGVEFRCYS